MIDSATSEADPVPPLPGRLPGDTWEVEGTKFKLAKWSDGSQGWHCDPGWIGEWCFVAGRAKLISRAPALSRTLNGDVEVGWRASARGTWQAYRRVGSVESSNDTGIPIVEGVGPPATYPWKASATASLPAQNGAEQADRWRWRMDPTVPDRVLALVGPGDVEAISARNDGDWGVGLTVNPAFATLILNALQVQAKD